VAISNGEVALSGQEVEAESGPWWHKLAYIMCESELFAEKQHPLKLLKRTTDDHKE
jgi:hypothetical protein